MVDICSRDTNLSKFLQFSEIEVVKIKKYISITNLMTEDELDTKTEFNG
jgi:glutaredoxin-related protein